MTKTAPKAARGGFTLIEVIVALMVAGILCTTFLGSQRQNIFFIEHAGLSWEHINYAQTIMAERDLTTQGSTMGWVGDPDDEDRQWRVTGSATSDGTLMSMEVRIDGAKTEWQWMRK